MEILVCPTRHQMAVIEDWAYDLDGRMEVECRHGLNQGVAFDRLDTATLIDEIRSFWGI
jgi:hypothetical protein